MNSGFIIGNKFVPYSRVKEIEHSAEYGSCVMITFNGGEKDYFTVGGMSDRPSKHVFNYIVQQMCSARGSNIIELHRCVSSGCKQKCGESFTNKPFFSRLFNR